MRVLVSLVLLSLLSFEPVAAATIGVDKLRLVGLVVSTEGRNLAFIELPDGKQILLREGDVIGDNVKVLAISRRSLRLRFSDGEKVLELSDYRDSTGSVVSDAYEVQIVQKKEDSDDHAIMNREVAVDALVTAFDGLSVAVEKGKIKNLSNYLAPLLDLPSKARIININHFPVGSVKEAITMISEGIAAGNVVSLTLDGNERVYLMPHAQQ